jgi:autotransporter-associated beta strand protein
MLSGKSRRFVRSLLVAATCTPAFAHAQTSGTWAVDVGTAGGNWSTASNWTGGVIPDGGGAATFLTLPTFTTAPVNIVQDLPTVTLSQMAFDSFITYLVRPPSGGPQTLTLSSPATVHAQRANINTLSTTFFGHLLQIPIAGSNGLTKTGPGTVTLWSANTYTGGTSINGGILVARQFGDACFGDPSGGININNGTIRVTTGAWTSARTVNLGGGATFEASTGNNITLNGVVSGPGNLNKIGGAGLIMSAANSYSGSTNVLAGTTTLNGNGALTSTSSLALRNTLTLDNSATNNTNRVNNAAPVTLLGSALTLTGSASASSSETLGDTAFSRGTSTVTVTPGAGQSALLALGNVSRNNGGTAFFRGTSLGASPAADVANITFASAPVLVGGGGSAGSTNISIVPWAYGSTAANSPPSSFQNTLVTYDPTTGVRPLAVSEFAATLAAAGATDNVRLTAGETLAAPKTVNALVLSGGGLINGAGVLSLTSGALLNFSDANIICGLDFGAAEGVIQSPSSITLTGVISGSDGLTKQGVGIATFANSANTYTGSTTLGGGTNVFLASVPSGASSPFGNSTSAIQLAPAGLGTGSATARLVYGGAGAASFDRPLNVSGRIALNNAATLPGFGVLGTQTLVMNGDITLDDSPLTILAPTGSTVTINGDITGSGGPLTNGTSAAGNIVLNGNNTFTGGAEIGGGTWMIGSDSALGTGMIKMAALAPIPTIIASGGPRIVPNETVSFGTTGTYWIIGGSNDITFAGDINLSGSFSHNITNTGLTTYAGALHTGGFTKTGPGTLVLTGDNIYNGATTVSAGVLRAAHANALGTPQSPTTVNTGAALEITGNSLSAEPVTISGFGVGSAGAIRSLAGNNTLGPVTLPASSSINVDAGTLRVGNVSSTVTDATLFKNGPGALSAERYRLRSVEVVAGIAAVTPGRGTDKTSVMESLLVLTGQFDLGDNDLVLDYDVSNPLTLIRNQIQSAYNNGAWNGTGLTSSLADASNFALGFAESSAIFTSFPATFSGIEVDNSAVLVRWTRYGDADLNGTVNLDDFNRLAANFGASDKVWSDGDFNYNGIVNLEDFNKLAANFGLTAGRDGPTPQDWSALANAVPEPGVVATTLLGSILLLRRGKRKG